MLSDLRLAQFRSHRAARLSLDGRPVAIWGANGAGKTSLLEAISLLSPGRGLRGAAPQDLARRGGPGGWRVATVVAGRAVETLALPGEPRQVRIDDKAATQTALGAVLRVIWLTPAMDRLWTEAPEGRRRFLDRLTLSLFPDHAVAALDYDRALRERNRLLRDGVRDGAWYAALEARLVAAGAVLTANRDAALGRLMAAQSGAGHGFPAADLSVVLPADAVCGDLALALAEGRARDMAAGRTLAGPHRADLAAVWADKGVPAALASTGEQKALLISLVLANARAVAADTGTPPVLLLDEVAAHLDPDRRAALYDAVCGLGVQAFLTGTEKALFSGLAGRAAGFVVRELAGVSSVEEAQP